MNDKNVWFDCHLEYAAKQVWETPGMCFEADGDKYLMTIPPRSLVEPLFFNQDTTPGPLYNCTESFAVIERKPEDEAFHLVSIRRGWDSASLVLPEIVSFYMREYGKPDGSSIKIFEMGFQPYIIPLKDDITPDMYAFAGEEDGTIHEGISLYQADRTVLLKAAPSQVLAANSFRLGDTRARHFTWVKAGPGLICQQPICRLETLDFMKRKCILNLPQLYE